VHVRHGSIRGSNSEFHCATVSESDGGHDERADSGDDHQHEQQQYDDCKCHYFCDTILLFRPGDAIHAGTWPKRHWICDVHSFGGAELQRHADVQEAHRAEGIVGWPERHWNPERGCDAGADGVSKRNVI
jgi:hypothetical protein